MKHLITALFSAIAFMGAAHASIYSYNDDGGDNRSNTGTGRMNSVYFHFRDFNNNERFSMNFNIDDIGNNAKSGHVIIQNTAPQNGTFKRGAIMYFDVDSGTVAFYERTNNWQNPQQADHIVTYQNALSYVDNGDNYDLSINLLNVAEVQSYLDPANGTISSGSGYNSPNNWEGIKFTNVIKYSTSLYENELTFDGDYIANFDRSGARTDFNNHPRRVIIVDPNGGGGGATPVNEPIGMSLLGLLGLGLYLRRRR